MFLTLVLALLLLSHPPSVHAETKVITADATYTMGDGESPSFAEAQVLQRAKQLALEQAGTYVESYTKVHNYDLTTEEMHTLAGGVLEVEVLEKTRALVGDGLRFSIKIKATVTTDKMEELAKRIKGRNIVEEYKKLQDDYARLNREIESWKQLIAKAPPGPERETALHEMREREKAFESVQKSEAALFERLVSGQALVASALDELDVLDALFERILQEGHIISIGEPKSHIVGARSGDMLLNLRIPITLRANPAIRLAMEETARSLGGDSATSPYERIFEDTQRRVSGTRIKIARDANAARYFQARVFGLTFVLHFLLDGSKSISCRIEDSHLVGSAFLEAHPIAKIDEVYNRWGRAFKLHHAEGWARDLDEFINDIEMSEELGVNSARWVSKTEILMLDRANKSLDKSLGPTALTSVEDQRAATYDKHNHIELYQRLQHAGIEGQIVVFDDERKFEIIAEMPISDVVGIQGIRAEFKESSSKEIAKLMELETKARNKKIKGFKESIVPSCFIIS